MMPRWTTRVPGALRASIWPAAALYVFVGAFPGLELPASSFLDREWILEVNRLPLGTFGSHVVFTYGPFAFLLHPAMFTTHVVLALLLRCTVLAGVAALVLIRGSTADRIVFAVAEVAAVRLGLAFEYQILVPVLLLAARSLGTPRRGEAAWAAVAGVALFAKFSLGIALGAMVGTAWFVRLLRDRTAAIRGVVFGAAAGCAALLAAAAVGLERVADLVPWIRRSLELSGGYGEIMAYSDAAGPDLTVFVAAAVVALLVGLGAWGTRHGSAPGRIALLSAGPAFVAFKQAFVRPDGAHATIYFPLLLSVGAAAALVASARVERILCRGAVAVTAALSLWVAHGHQLLSPDPVLAVARSLSGLDGADALRAWLDVEERRAEIPRRLAPHNPPSLAAALGGGTVGVVPSRIAFCAMPGVTCTPNPTLQTFATYTASLDSWSSDHYLGERAPHFVLLQGGSIDGRSPALDHPALWRALIAAYRIYRLQPGGGLLLERRSSFVRPELVEVGRMNMPVEGWVTVPDLPGHLYAAITLDPTWIGRAQRFAFRVRPVFLVLEYPGGKQVAVRLVPDTARNGLPLDDIPLDPEDLGAFVEGQTMRRPYRIALAGEGLESYRQPIALAWQQPVSPERRVP